MTQEPAPPPLGKPIRPDTPVEDDQPDQRPGEHVVVVPFTAGSAGAAHSDPAQED